MSRIHEMGRVVYWSAGALLFLNCVPHTLPGILKKRCALHSVNCTHCTPSLTAHYTLHTFTHCTHRTLVHYTQLSHTAHTVVSLKARLRQRNWWLMFTELQLPWYVQSPSDVLHVGVAATLPPSHTPHVQSLPHPERIRVFITEGFSSE